MTIIVEFGSRVRGDNDTYSDKDVLIVPNKDTSLPHGKHFHVYTKNRLLKIRISKSLFLIHLRDEGNIISDERGWMKSFLRNIPDYITPLSELHTARMHLAVLLSISPTEEQLSWWLDCTYVFLRDFLIKRNSTNGKYSFSPHEFGKIKNTNYPIDLTEVIMNLRIGKSIHRSANITQVNNQIDWIKTVLVEALKFNKTPMLLKDAYDKFKGSVPYFELRLLEGLLLNNEVTSTNDKIIKLIKNPQMYSWEIKQRDFEKELYWLNKSEALRNQ